MPSTAVADSGPFIALFDRDDAYHEAVVAFLAGAPALRLLTTWAVLTETSALLAGRVGKGAELDFLEWVHAAGIEVAPQDATAVPRIRALVAKYRDLPFDFADASVAVLAAQAGVTQVLTLDRDFEIYRDARGRRLRNLLAPALARMR